MAKLKAPLMSLGASGQIGKSLVYFPWKGINAVRKHVVPTNPKTSGQTTQRSHLTAAVANIHACMQYASHPLDAADKIALALWGSTFATPRTWFNMAVKQWVDRRVDGLLGFNMTDGGTTPGAGQLAVSIWAVGGDVTAGRFYYGTTKACVSGYVASTPVGANHTATITGLTAGVKYYWQFVGTAPASYVDVKSGVYYGKPT